MKPSEMLRRLIHEYESHKGNRPVAISLAADDFALLKEELPELSENFIFEGIQGYLNPAEAYSYLVDNE